MKHVILIELMVAERGHSQNMHRLLVLSWYALIQRPLQRPHIAQKRVTHGRAAH
jgi:hypothetical protein